MKDFMLDETIMIGVDKNGFSDREKDGLQMSEDKLVLRDGENHDDGVRRLLSTYDLGQKLRQLRLRKKIALVDLGKHTGLSASMLSQLENGKLVPTLPTLARIAMVFDVGLEHFFVDKKNKRLFSIVRAAERLKFPELPDSPTPGYFFEVLAFGATDKAMAAYLAEFPQHDLKTSRHHVHNGSEFVHVLEGQLAINYQSEDHVLEAGDSVYFDASEPHSYSGQTDQITRAIVVTAQPRL